MTSPTVCHRHPVQQVHAAPSGDGVVEHTSVSPHLKGIEAKDSVSVLLCVFYGNAVHITVICWMKWKRVATTKSVLTALKPATLEGKHEMRPGDKLLCLETPAETTDKRRAERLSTTVLRKKNKLLAGTFEADVSDETFAHLFQRVQ